MSFVYVDLLEHVFSIKVGGVTADGLVPDITCAKESKDLFTSLLLQLMCERNKSL